MAGWQPHFRSEQDSANGGIMYMEHDHNKSIKISSELFDFLQFIIKSDWPQLINLSIAATLNKEWLKISQIYYSMIPEN